MSELEASSEVEAQTHLIPALFEPRSCGVTEGPQAWLLKKKSRALLISLHKAQDPWGPSGLPSARTQALHQVEYRLKSRVSQAIRRLKALQAMLALSSHSQTFGWGSSKGLQTLEGFLEEEGTALGLLLPELHSDLCCLESHLAGGLPCPSPRCEEVASALWAGRLPPPWRRHMPAGPQPPWLWLHQLWCQGQLLTKYLSLCGQLGMGGFDQQNRSFHLSAFRHPRGLLLAVRWEASQNKAYSYNAVNLSSSVIPSTGRPPPTCPAPVPGARPRFQLSPNYISPSRNPSPKLDPARHSPTGGPQPSVGPSSRGDPQSSLGPSPGGHSFSTRLGLSYGFSTGTSPRLNMGRSPTSTFSFGPNLNTGIPRQGIEAIRLQFQVECGPTPLAPEGGLLITGLLLHHAEWDPEDRALQDGHSGKPSPLPPVSVSPHFINQDLPLPSSPLPFYLCPVYLGGVLGSSRLDHAHLLLYLPLPTKLSPAICVQRRVYVCSPPLI